MRLSREEMLLEMGIRPVWKLREGALGQDLVRQPSIAVAETDLPAPNFIDSDPPPAASPGGWELLEQSVKACRACGLCEQRRQTVFGVGDRQAEWLFIGEGPGAEEDARGEPFVGQAGKLLDAMLAALALQRGENVYIANAVKCRPPGNRTPDASEMTACHPYLAQQITLIRPKVIVLLGKAAVLSMLHMEQSLSSLRGRRFDYQGIPVVVTYHPAYLLRNLPDKAKAWEDLLFARRVWREAAAALPI